MQSITELISNRDAALHAVFSAFERFVIVFKRCLFISLLHYSNRVNTITCVHFSQTENEQVLLFSIPCVATDLPWLVGIGLINRRFSNLDGFGLCR